MKMFNSQNRFFRFGDLSNLLYFLRYHNLKRRFKSETQPAFRLFSLLYRILFIVLLMKISFIMSGQSCSYCINGLQNPTLDLVNPLPPNTVSGLYTFQQGLVPYWTRSYGTPHHINYDVAQSLGFLCLTMNGTNPGTVINCLNGSTEYNLNPFPQTGGFFSENKEAVHTNYNFVNNPFLYYCINYELDRIDCYSSIRSYNASFSLRAGNDIAENTQMPLVLPWNPALPTDFEDIGTVQVNNIGLYTGNIIYNPAKNYSQFQLLMQINNPQNQLESATVSVKKIEICCKTTAMKGFTAELQGNLGCGLTYKFTPSINHNGCTKDETYSWYIKDPLNNTSEAPFATSDIPTYTFQYGGKYTVCLQYKDCNGCTAEVCQEVNVNACNCEVQPGYTYIDASAPGGATISSIFPSTTVFNNVKWVVKGNLIIDKNIELNSAHLLMDKGAKITVNPSKRLWVVNKSLIEGCVSMWDGIYYSGTGLNLVLNSEIRDAQYGLRITNKAAIHVQSSRFTNNWVGINAGNAARPLLSFIGNTFEKDPNTSMKPKYPLQQYYDADRPYAGIFSTNSSLNLDGTYGRNYFKNMTNGITMDKSNIICLNNEFENLVGYKQNNSLFASKGVGIFMSNIPIEAKIDSNVFISGHLGIQGVNMNSSKVEIIKNEFSDFNVSNTGSFSKGIDLNNGSLTNLHIKRNNLSNNYYGISVSNIGAPSSLSVFKNIIESNRNNILLDNVNCFFTSGLINENVLTNTQNLGSTSMQISNSSGIKCFENEIALNPITSSILTGFAISKSSFSSFEKNTVTASTALSKSFGVDASGLNLYSCNKLLGGGRGFDFTNSCSGTVMTSNIIGNITISGLELNNASISNQPYKGNIWAGGNSSAKLLNGSKFEGNIFTYNNNEPTPTLPNSLTGGSWKPASITPVTVENLWFDPQTNQNNDVCIWPSLPVPIMSSIELNNIASGIVLNNQYYNQNVWTSQLNLLQLIDREPSVLVGNTTLTNFYNGNSSVKAYHLVQKSIDDLYNPTSYEAININSIKQQQNQLESDLNILLANVTDATYGSAEPAINTKMDQITLLNDSLQAILTGINARATASAQSLKTTVVNLPEPHGFCVSYKTVLAARLELITDGSESVKIAKGQIIKSIAESCDLELGNPVYLAQSLCTELGIDFVNLEDCSNARSSEKIHADLSNEYNIYPNPADNNISITGRNKINNIYLYDIDGKELYSIYNVDNNNYNLSLNGLSNGIYLIKIIDQDNVSTIKRIAKI